MIESKKITNPFPGLRPFETDEYRLFFGREGQSDALITRLQRARFLAVVGTSGSGKSSLVRAGLLPALRGGMMAGAGSGWRITIMRPGSDPIGNLAGALAEKDVLLEAGGGLPPAEAEAVIEATLRRGSLGLVDAARQARLNEHEKLLVVVDQFEELFRFRAARATTSTDDDASAFVKLLLEAAQQRELSIYVVPTMRSDFLGDCAQFQGLPEAINDGQYLIPRMTRDERHFAITGPVGVKRRKITEPLVNRLMNDVGDNPDQLPILQHALMRTWDYWAAHRRNGEPIGLEHYEAIGTMSDALSEHADEAWTELDERGRLIAEILFKALTERGADNREIRRPTRLRAICEIAGASLPEAAAVIEVFRGGGRSFLMPPAGVALRPETVIDISHESLIRNWRRLQVWVNEEAQSARIYRRLAEAAVLHREGSEGLLQDPGLQIALDWRDKSKPTAAWAGRYHPEFDESVAYLEQSSSARDAALAEREHQRNADLERERREREQAERFAAAQARSARRLRWLAAGMAVMFLLALGTAAYAMAARNGAKESEKRARLAQLAAQKSEGEAKEFATNLQAEKDKTDQLAVNLGKEKKKTDEALTAERKALDSQKQATARANEQKLAAERSQREAQNNLKRTALSMERSSEQVAGVAEFQRGDYNEALKSFNSAGHWLNEEVKAIEGSSMSQDNKHWTQLNLQAIRGSLFSNGGAVLRSLEKYDDAVWSYSEALRLQTAYDAESKGKVEWNMFDSMLGLAHAYRDRANYVRNRANGTVLPEVQADNDKAEQFLEKAVATQQRLLNGKDPGRLASSYEELARLYHDLGKNEKAEPVYKRILEMREKLPEKQPYIATLIEAGKFYGALKKPKDAEALFKKAIDILEKVNSDADVPQLVEAYTELGNVYTVQEGKESKAQSAFQLARAFQDLIARSKQGEEEILNNTSLNVTVELMADAYAGLGKYERAAELYEGVFVRQQIRADLQVIARVVHKRAELYRERLHDYPKAEEQYKILLEAATQNPDSSFFPMPQALRDLGSLYANEMNRPAEAEPLLKRSLELSSNAPKGTYPPLEVNKALAELAKLYRRQNRTAELESAQKTRVENAGKILSDAFGRLGKVTIVALRSYTEAAQEYLEANGELASRYQEQHKEDDLLALYRAMLGDMTQDTSNPASCCIRLDSLTDVSIFDLYSKLLGDYRQLLLARRMAEQAAKVAEFIDKVKSRQEDAKKFQLLLR